MHIVKFWRFQFYADFGLSNDFLVVHGDSESYDDDNPPRGKHGRRLSNWNTKDCQECKPWPLSGCPLWWPIFEIVGQLV